MAMQQIPSSVLFPLLRRISALEGLINRMAAGGERPGLSIWTPVLSQVGTLSYTSHQCLYQWRGPTVWVHMDVVLTSTSGGAATGIGISGLPVSIGETAQGASLGTFRFSRGGTHYIGSVVANTATAVWLICNAATGALGDNPSITATSGDLVSMTIEYIPA